MKEISKYKEWGLIALILSFISLFAIYLRTLHWKDIINPLIVNLLGNDSWYNMRQIEYIFHTGKYLWFDPMTSFPSGENVFWGPVFTSFCALICQALGAVSKLDIMIISSFIPPLLIVGVIIGVFIYSYRVYDSLIASIISAFIIAILPGQLYYRSLFGFVDHHIMEVFLGIIFSLFYIITLRRITQGCEETLPKRKKLLLISGLFWCILTGITFLLGLFTVTTFTIFGLIIGLNTAVYLFYLHYSKTISKAKVQALVYTQIGVFTLVICGLNYMGFQHIISLSRYTIFQPLIYFILVSFTFLLSYFIWYYRDSSPIKTWGGIILVSSVVLTLMDIFLLGGIIYQSIGEFFGFNQFTSTVGECNFLSWEKTFSLFSFGLIPTLIGVIALLEIQPKHKDIEILYTVSWGITMLIIASLHTKYEYFLGVNIAIFMGIGIVKLLSLRKNNLSMGKIKINLEVPIIAITLLLFALIIPHYIQLDCSLSKNIANTTGNLDEDWLDTLYWVKENTPHTGVDFYGIYGEDYSYPQSAYSIASWWDYGHHITYLSERIPISNPFQRGVSGKYGVAHLFITPYGEETREILNKSQIKYLIIDDKMMKNFFSSIAIWDNKDPLDYMFIQEGILTTTQNYSNTFMVNLYEGNLDDFKVVFTSKNQKIKVFEYLYI